MATFFHVPPMYTEPGWNMHTAQVVGRPEYETHWSHAGTNAVAILTMTVGGQFGERDFLTV